MIHRMVTYDVRKDALPQALAAVAAFVDEVARKEGGTASYKAFQHADPPTRLTTLMEFRTPAAEAYHQKTPWGRKFNETLLPLCASPPIATTLSPVA